MCGRARLPNDYSEIKIRLRFGDSAKVPNLRPSWNIAPTQDMLCAIHDPKTGDRVPLMAHWGMIPPWAKEPKMKYPTFNARAEGFDTKASFRNAWKKGQRCLVITDGFYEWRKHDKQPFAVGLRDDLTVMAGLWETWKGPSEKTRSCTIITTDANQAMSALHDRMPVILKEDAWPTWMGEEKASETELKALLQPYEGGGLIMWPVDKRVGNVRNNSPELVTPTTS